MREVQLCLVYSSLLLLEEIIVHFTLIPLCDIIFYTSFIYRFIFPLLFIYCYVLSGYRYLAIKQEKVMDKEECVCFAYLALLLEHSDFLGKTVEWESGMVLSLWTGVV